MKDRNDKETERRVDLAVHLQKIEGRLSTMEKIIWIMVAGIVTLVIKVSWTAIHIPLP